MRGIHPSITIPLPSFYEVDDMSFWKELHNYKPSDFDSPDKKGSHALMNEDLCFCADKASDDYGKRLNINSAVRTPEHNKKVGGVKNSSHLTGHAIDVNCPDERARFCILEAAHLWKIPRILIYKTFVHLDVDMTKKLPGVWLM